jgi:SAM-dependent methyltransferase
MKTKELVNCPLCGSSKAINMLNLNCGNFDDSTLYRTVKVHACERCGHVYNRLLPDEIVGLMKYYDEEYAPVNIGSTDKTGDRPGSNNQNTLGRYDQLYDMMLKYIDSNVRVLDVGCAMGGFLDYLHAKGIKSLSGIDTIPKYINYAKRKNNYTIKLGSAESIPFEDNSFDLLVMDQVLEHLIEPRRAFQEAKRVLVEGGLFCIGVPDALRYDKTFFFDFYWFLMREHIQHFDSEHIKLLAESEGFVLVGFSKGETPMMSEKMILPNLNVVFRLTGKKSEINIVKKCFILTEEIETYVANELERLNKKKAVIHRLLESQRPVYAWGIGREFLYLYESAGLKQCAIVGLIDANPYKQNNCVLDGKKLIDRAILSKVMPDSVLIITAIAHTAQIQKTLKEIGYSGEVLTLEN